MIDVNNDVSLFKNKGTASNPTVLTSSLLKNSNEDNLDSGWYVLNSSFTYDERIVISGNVHLILKDGCTLTANQGIRINTDATLSIYAQSEKVGTMGKLVATETHHDKAAIGGNKDYEAGRLFIHGGEIEADADDGKYAAGIGGGYGDGSGMKAITIYSGTVTANAGSYSAGIGGGWQRDGGYVRISGGTVTAENTGAGASIGGGDGASGGTIEITGGRVIAKATKLYGESVHPACNIGSGAGKNNQTIILGSNICVKSESGLVVASQRIEACKGPQSSPSSWHGSQLWTVEVYACAHDTVSYTINDASKHTIHCKHCDYTKNEEHSIVAPSTTCEKCGYGEGTTICTLAFPETSTAEVSGYATAGFQAVQGRAIAMPACTKVPEGWTFVGWLRQSNAPSSIEAADSEGTLWQPGSLYIVEGDEIFFARYRYDFTETWTWDDDLTTASLTIQAADGEPINVTPVTVGDRTATAATDAADGSIKATATATYTHGNTTYTFSDTQTKVLSYNLSLGEDDNRRGRQHRGADQIRRTLHERHPRRSHALQGRFVEHVVPALRCRARGLPPRRGHCEGTDRCLVRQLDGFADTHLRRCHTHRGRPGIPHQVGQRHRPRSLRPRVQRRHPQPNAMRRRDFRGRQWLGYRHLHGHL